MIPRLIALCVTLTVLWCVIYWTRDRLFRVVLIVSVGLHALAAIPLSGIYDDGPGSMSGGTRVIQYEFIQGAPEKDPSVIDEKTEDKPPLEEELSIPDLKKTSAEADLPLDEKPDEEVRREIPGTVEKGLPRIEQKALVSFKMHPERESYRKELKRLIKENIEVPEQLLRDGHRGRQLVFFKLTREGELIALFIDETSISPNPMVNATSLNNIRRISVMFPPLPGGVLEREVWFKVNINYKKQ